MASIKFCTAVQITATNYFAVVSYACFSAIFLMLFNCSSCTNTGYGS